MLLRAVRAAIHVPVPGKSDEAQIRCALRTERGVSFGRRTNCRAVAERWRDKPHSNCALRTGVFLTYSGGAIGQDSRQLRNVVRSSMSARSFSRSRSRCAFVNDLSMVTNVSIMSWVSR